MTKLKRFTGKVFGGSATAVGDDPQIAQFGSALANTFVGTTDPETIQQLPAWGQGWIGAVTPTQQYPALPEMTGAMKVLSHQICGILQQGVSTWDSGTIYYTGNFCSKNGIVYVSLSDLNQGNDPEVDTINWRNYGGADIDLSNLSDIGKNIGNWSTNLTNCWTKIPQRIKYTLVDGALTILAGTVAIFPYGTEDKTAEFPIGSTFLNDNFKVVDTYWDGSKFFVWAEFVNSLAPSKPISAIKGHFLFCNATGNELARSETVASGDTYTATKKFSYWYDTANNYVRKFENDLTTPTTAIQSLPLLTCDGDATGTTKIQHTFNGWGYIGGIIWREALEGLISRGYNEDGTYNNYTLKASKITFYGGISSENTGRTLFVTPQNTASDCSRLRCFEQEEEPNITGNSTNSWYNPKTNETKTLYNEQWNTTYRLKFLTYFADGTKITGVTDTPQTFRPLDIKDKQLIQGWALASLMPDYSKGVQIASYPYTTPAEGWIIGYTNATTSTYLYMYLDGQPIGAEADDYINITVPVSKGQVLTASTTSIKQRNLYFYPMKGNN